jgi:hypothetical protein
MLLKHHALEEHYLRRRLELLEYLDSFARDELYNDDPETMMKPDDPKLVILSREYSDVLNPVDLEKTLKEIYPTHLYAPPEK